MNVSWLLGLGIPTIFLVAGVVLVVSGVRGNRRTDAWVRTAVTTTGVVVSSRLFTLQQSWDDYQAGSAVLLATVRFTLPDGRVVEAESTQGSNVAPRDGSRVKVHYQPQDPMHPRVGGTLIPRSISIGSVVIGASFVVLSLPVLVGVVFAFRAWG